MMSEHGVVSRQSSHPGGRSADRAFPQLPQAAINAEKIRLRLYRSGISGFNLSASRYRAHGRGAELASGADEVTPNASWTIDLDRRRHSS
jgi:hypothetical protein